MKFKFSHASVCVRSMDTAVEFYTKVMGGQIASTQIIDGDTHTFVQIADQLIKFVEKTNADYYGLTHLAFETDDIQSAYTYFSDLGYEFILKPQDAISKNGLEAYFKDVNGIIIQLMQLSKSLYVKSIPSPIVCSLDHYAVNCRDIKETHELFHKHLQMENLAHFIVGDNIREIMYLNSEMDTLELVESSANDLTANPHAHVCFRAEDIDKTFEMLKKSGVDFGTKVPSAPGIQVGRSIGFKDPIGLKVELVGRVDLRDFDKNGFTVDTVDAMRPF